jgi:hypothetical protein
MNFQVKWKGRHLCFDCIYRIYMDDDQGCSSPGVSSLGRAWQNNKSVPDLCVPISMVLQNGQFQTYKSAMGISSWCVSLFLLQATRWANGTTVCFLKPRVPQCQWWWVLCPSLWVVRMLPPATKWELRVGGHPRESEENPLFTWACSLAAETPLLWAIGHLVSDACLSGWWSRSGTLRLEWETEKLVPQPWACEHGEGTEGQNQKAMSKLLGCKLEAKMGD